MSPHRKSIPQIFVWLCLASLLSLSLSVFPLASEVLTPEDVLRMKTCASAEMSPDGKWIASTVSVPREPSDQPGGPYNELYVVAVESGQVRPFITGQVNISSPRWSPDSKRIAFLTARGENKTAQVWVIPVDGGEASAVSKSESAVLDFRWHPSGEKIAYIAETPPTDNPGKLGNFSFSPDGLKLDE